MWRPFLELSHFLFGKRAGKAVVRRRPRLEALEDRTAPAVFTVTSTGDAGVGDPATLEGDLRWCINQIDGDTTASASQPDTIAFNIPTNDPGYNATTEAYAIVLTSALPALTGDVNITGPGATELLVSGAGQYQVLAVNAGATAGISGLTLRDGLGGGGGGIYNAGNLTLADCTLTNNYAMYDGGAVATYGVLTATDTVFSANSATGQGGAIITGFGTTTTLTGCSFAGNAGGDGGGIHNDDALTVTNCTFSANSTQAGDGGGIVNYGTATISTSSFSGNHAVDAGGALANYGTLTITGSSATGNVASNGGGIYTGSGDATITTCILQHNQAAGGAGGGIYLDNGTLTILGSTLSADSASDYDGGGLFVSSTATSVNVANSTFSGNSAAYGGGLWNYFLTDFIVADSTFSGNSQTGTSYAAGITNYSGAITLNNTIVANSIGGPDLGGFGLFAGSNDLIGDGSDLRDLASSLQGNPLLAPLRDYGGPTPTMALLPGSLAIDTGSSTAAPATDQRGIGRVGAVDIGAFESQGFTLTVVGDHVQDTVIDSAFASPLTVQVAANNPAEPVDGGEITFLAPASGASAILNGNPAGIQGGQASVTATANGTAGSYTVWATAAAAAGVPVSLTNAKAATTTAVSASAGPGLPGHAMSFTTSVSGKVRGLPLGGTVDFFDSTTGTDLGSVALVSGRAALTTRTLAVGGHTIVATYSGNADYLRSPGTTAVTVLAPASLAGTVFVDFNDDGLGDFGEVGIRDVTITLTGTDDLGRPVRLSQQTNTHGSYVFNNLRPGSYNLTERQPAGYLQGNDIVGTAGGSVVATDRFSIQLGQGVNGMGYNYGERPAATGPVHASQSAGIAFWNGSNGQALLNSFNGGPTATELATWLAATLPNLFGNNAGSNSLMGKSNADVAALFQQDFQAAGVQLDAQVLATALNVYATNATLDASRVAAHYGFTITKYGIGTDAVPVGSNGAAFGVANHTTRTVMDLLLATDAQATAGVLYGGNATQRAEAASVYAAVNEARRSAEAMIWPFAARSQR